MTHDSIFMLIIMPSIDIKIKCFWQFPIKEAVFYFLFLPVFRTFCLISFVFFNCTNIFRHIKIFFGFSLRFSTLFLGFLVKLFDLCKSISSKPQDVVLLLAV